MKGLKIIFNGGFMILTGMIFTDACTHRYEFGKHNQASSGRRQAAILTPMVQKLNIHRYLDAEGKSQFGLTGNSVGGATSINLAANYLANGIPKPKFL